MNDLASRPPLGLKPQKPKKDPAYLASVRAERCCICEAFGEVQMTPTEAHHPICGRHSQRKRPDGTAIPLCHDHHLGWKGIHPRREWWVETYGEDTDWIAPTQDKLRYGQ